MYNRLAIGNIAGTAAKRIHSNVSLAMLNSTRTYVNVSAKESVSAVASWTDNKKLQAWVDKYVKHMQPDRVHLCDGSEEEKKFMIECMVRAGTLIPLNQEKRPGCYLARSDVGDVARVEKQTIICSKKEEDAGPTNNWADAKKTEEKLMNLYKGCMKGRTMFVVPYSMGPVGSPLAENGVELTDSPYVALSMKVMTRMGENVIKSIGSNGPFVEGVHSVGKPLVDSSKEDAPWPCNNQEKIITHFPEDRKIMSYGSGYGGNALLGKKCFALRIASVMARDNGWLAEHMLILGITNPQGVKKYVAAAFPSACGKTNLAMLVPTIPGWKVTCVGDDIAWMRFDEEGRLRAINPENGFFGVAPGTSEKTNPVAMATASKNTIFTNVAMTEDNDVWWEGMSKQAPKRLTDWLRRDWVSGESKYPAAHPNSRFCSPASQCPIIDPAWEDPKGVPIDAIIFGGRRGTAVPLVYQSRSWEHGTFLGATMGSEQTAAAEGQVGAYRSDPMAMKPFIGYHAGDYFQHWLNVGAKSNKVPKIFFVNWFRKGPKGEFLWPGFGDNSRVLKWVIERVDGKAKGIESPIGTIPDVKNGELDVSGLNISNSVLDELFALKKSDWKKEIQNYRENFKIYGSKLPKELNNQLAELEKNVEKMRD